MERLFKVIAHKDRLWIVRYLLAHGPTRQKDLRAALAATGRERLNDGMVSNWVGELADVGLVQAPERKQDPVCLANVEQVGGLLAIASALRLSATAAAHAEAAEQHAEVRRSVTKLHRDAESG